VLAIFNREFEIEKRRLFLYKIGLDPTQAKALSTRPPAALTKLMKSHARFEKRRSSRGLHRVPDGLTWNAVYCMRDVLRELPSRLLENATQNCDRIAVEELLEIALSDYASRKDRVATPYRRRAASRYQRSYLEFMDWIARHRGCDRASLLAEIAPKAASRNPYARMTGDGLTHATRRIASSRRRLAAEETYRLVQAFARSQNLSIEAGSDADSDPMAQERPLVQRIYRDLQRLAVDHRESL
jgi:hypothetical protein